MAVAVAYLCVLPHPFGSVTSATAALLPILIGALASLANKWLNIMRSLTSLWTTMFIASCTLPAMLDAQGSTTENLMPTVMALVILGSTVALMSAYNSESRNRIVFLGAFMLGTGAIFSWAFIPYGAVYIAGLAQMRIFNPRALTATVLGFVTPWWTAWAFGWLDFGALPWDFVVDEFTVADLKEHIIAVVAVVLTAVCAIAFLAVNTLKILGYNARYRALNGYLALLLAASVAAMAIVPWHFTAFLPTMLLAATYQPAHFFAANRAARSYIAILLLTLSYLALPLV